MIPNTVTQSNNSKVAQQVFVTQLPVTFVCYAVSASNTVIMFCFYDYLYLCMISMFHLLGIKYEVEQHKVSFNNKKIEGLSHKSKHYSYSSLSII